MGQEMPYEYRVIPDGHLDACGYPVDRDMWITCGFLCGYHVDKYELNLTDYLIM